MANAEPTLSPTEKILILLPDRDSPPKKDWKHVFYPEATKLRTIYQSEGATVSLVQIAVPTVDPKTLTVAPGAKQTGFETAANATIAAISSSKWSRVIFLCHGWDTGLQLGFRSRKQRANDAANLSALIAALRKNCSKTITLFACSAGNEPGSAKTGPGTGDNSIADLLRDATGCTVIAHWSAGHATRNPDLIIFQHSTTPVIGGVAWPERRTTAYRNAVRLLTVRKDPVKNKAPGQFPPREGTRPAFASIPLCYTPLDLQKLLSMHPAF